LRTMVRRTKSPTTVRLLPVANTVCACRAAEAVNR
jgi:hypothetical protein